VRGVIKLPKGKKTQFEWWLDRLNTLTGYNKEARNIYERFGRAYKKRYWTLLKLALLAYYIDIYTNIAKKHFNRIVYIDLFAGCGINEIEVNNRKEVVLGSAMLAKKVPRNGKEFDKLILVEVDQENAKMLEEILPDALVIPGDCNKASVLREIIDEVYRVDKTHFLALMDPEGLELKWRTVETLLQHAGDSIINYMCAGVGRNWGNWYSERTQETIRKSLENTITEYFGCEDWKNCPPPDQGGSAENLFELYLNRVRNFKEKAIPIKVKGLKGFHYHLILAVRKTGGAQGWIDAIYRARARIEKTTEQDIEKLLDVFQGRQSQLF